jgi:hypothetical protein
MIISIDAEKTFVKIQHPFMIKALMKLGIEGMCLNTIKAIYNKPIANIILQGKTETSSSKVRKEKRVSLSSFLFNIVLDFLTRAIRQEGEMKVIQIGKEDIKLSLFADDMILSLKDSENSIKKTLRYNKQLQ